MTNLSVNVNKIATLRNARGSNLPDLLTVSKDIVRFGAQGITVHPRPDGRHIRTQDVFDLKKHINVELNVEGYPSVDFLNLVKEISPEQVTLVPDKPDVLTSNAGWKVGEESGLLEKAIHEIKKTRARVSLFVDPKDYVVSDFKDVVELGADAVELYTECYARMFHSPEREDVLETYKQVATRASLAGLRINAGHDLNLDNLHHFVSNIGCVTEVSIGHALICDALYYGLEKTIQLYLKACRLD